MEDDDARRIEKEIALPATPEQVWEAVATGPGISAWYVPHEIYPGEGGLVSLGPGLDGRVLAWEEGVRFAYGRFPLETPEQPDYLYDFRIAVAEEETDDAEADDEADGEADVAEDAAEVEVEVEENAEDAESESDESDESADAEESDDSDETDEDAGDPTTSVLTFVQTGFPEGEEWDAEYASFDQGWDLFFGNLVAYLTHFPGQEAVSAVAGASPDETASEAWTTLLKGLGLETEPTVGAEVELTPEGPDAIEGTVDVLEPGKLLGVRSVDGLHRFVVEGEEPCTVSIYHYLYGAEIDEELDVDQLTGDWQEWLDELFPLEGAVDELEDVDEADEVADEDEAVEEAADEEPEATEEAESTEAKKD